MVKEVVIGTVYLNAWTKSNCLSVGTDSLVVRVYDLILQCI